jgi:hypothetical protein
VRGASGLSFEKNLTVGVLEIQSAKGGEDTLAGGWLFFASTGSRVNIF